MTIEEFNKKYQLNFSETAYDRTLINIAARRVTIAYSDSRLPTAEKEETELSGSNGQLAYIKHLQNSMRMFAKFRPVQSDDASLDGLIADYESMIAELHPRSRKPFEGIPAQLFRLLKEEAIAIMPEDSVKAEANLIENNAKARKESTTGYAKNRLADFLRKGKTADAVESLKAMENIHASHGWKFGNIFKNIREAWAIRSMKNALKEALGGREAFERAYAQEPEKYGYKEEENRKIEAEIAKQAAAAKEKEAKAQESPARENVHVAEAEEPAPETSEKTEEIQPVAPQKELQ